MRTRPIFLIILWGGFMLIKALNEVLPQTVGFGNLNDTQQKFLVYISIAVFLTGIIDFWIIRIEKRAIKRIRKFDVFRRLYQFPQGDYSINGELTVFEPHWRILIYEKYSIKEINWLIKQGVLHESEVLIPIEGKKNDYTEYKRIL